MKRSLAVAAAVLVMTSAGCTGGTAPEEAELVVLLKPNVMDDERSTVQQRMRATSNVVDVTFESRDQAYERYKRLFEDRPGALEQTPESMPESFVATITDASIAEAVEVKLAAVEGVDSVVIRATSATVKTKTIGVILRLAADVTDDRRDAIDKAVHALPQAKSIKVESAEDAFERLKKRCGGRADLAAALGPTKTSPSIRFKIGLKKPSPGFEALQKRDGVEFNMLFVPVSTL